MNIKIVDIKYYDSNPRYFGCDIYGSFDPFIKSNSNIYRLLHKKKMILIDPPTGYILKINAIEFKINLVPKKKDEIIIYGEIDKRNYELCPFCNMWGSPKKTKKNQTLIYSICRICEQAWFDFIEINKRGRK